jgi:hypothetical protein
MTHLIDDIDRSPLGVIEFEYKLYDGEKAIKLST